MSQKFSAIDIGSNAIRMIVAEWDPVLNHPLKIVKKWRAPIRLGEDVFSQGKITEKSIEKAIKAFAKFQKINKKYNIDLCRAIGTSALREALNKQEFIQKIEQETQIKIELIDGIEEGRLVYHAVQKEVQMEKYNTLLIDIGGGSVELTYSEKGQIIKSQSFPMGTVRTLSKLTEASNTLNLQQYIKTHYTPLINNFINNINGFSNIDFSIGTGGNFECMGELKLQILKKTPPNYLTLNELNEIAIVLTKLTVKERIKKFDLREDRADVILPAILLTVEIMTQLQGFKLIIPRVGLRDGILWSMTQSIPSSAVI